MVKTTRTDEEFMRMALKEAVNSKSKGEWIGGAVLVKNGKIIAKAGNTVKSKNDPTAHSEINVIRLACHKMKTINLKRVDLYTNAEPCPMCMAACVWANIRNVYFGASLEELIKLGDNQIKITSQEIARKARKKIGVTGGVLHDESITILK